VGERNLGESGQPEPLQIVCGAQNFVAGDKVAVATIGTIMPDGMQIKKSKLRGVASQGMNCSSRELGLGADHEGIMILATDAPVGTPLAQYLESSDTILDLEITPNRPDCMSMLGVAREVAAVYGTTYQLGRDVPEPEFAEDVNDYLRVTIDDPKRSARYTGRIIKGVKIGPSPDWLAERVAAAGARSINNIVDVTNYIMFELGQPLHAFDLDTLTKDADGKAHIVVRAATDAEKFTTLDDIERTLTNDVSVIVDGNAKDGAGQTIALAGVMGGLDSEVTDKTVNILLEAATFESGHTSRTSRNLQLFSEAAGRYERGVDDATCDSFSARAAALIAEVAGGTVLNGVVDAYPTPKVPANLELRPERLRKFIGADISNSEISAILTRLGCQVTNHPEVSIVTPPTYRPDLEREVDLYEEVLRVWGMERVESTLPGGSGRIGSRTIEQQRLDVIGNALRSTGLNETMTYAFASEQDLEQLRMPQAEGAKFVELINPMNSEHSIMRSSIIPGLLRSVAYNQSRGVNNVHLYEIGAVFVGSEGHKLPKECKRVAAVLAGSWQQTGWNDQAVPLDFFDAKGIIQNLARELNIAKLRFKALDAEAAPWLQPGRAAQILAGDKILGWVGDIHPLSAKAFELDGEVIAFELELKSLLAAAQPKREYVDVSLFPAVELDLAIVLDEAVSAERVLQVITSAGGQLLESARLFDVFRDDHKVGPGKKSLALSLSYRAPDRTLTSEEVEKLHNKVIKKLSGATGGTIRS
jgi:phenylalanyl-tRNA synthetase beta chain